MPCKACCKFIGYMANKPDKFVLKFWMAVDVETKYLLIGLFYLGKDDSRLDNVSVPTSAVMKLMIPLFEKGYYVTCDNYFMLFDRKMQYSWDNLSESKGSVGS